MSTTTTTSPVLPLTATEVAETAETYRAAVTVEATTGRATLEQRVAAIRAEDDLRLAGHRTLALLLSAERLATLNAARALRLGDGPTERADAFRAAILRTNAVQDYLLELAA